MSRITWKNVAAPNTGDVVRQQAIASRMINDGATGIGSTLQDLQTNSNRKLSAGAMQELSQIQDISKFDELMKNGGLSQLGISADRASPELNQMLQGYRDTLEGKRKSDQGFKEDVFQFGEDKYDASRERIQDQREDLNYDRGEEVYQRNKEDRLMNERATEEAREIAMDGSILNEADIRDAVNARAGDDLEYRDALMQAALSRSEDVTRIDENIALQPENQQRVQSFQDTQRGLRENLLLERTAGKNDADRMLFNTMASISEGGFSNPLDAMIDRFLGTEPDGDGDERKTYDETTASITKTFNTLKGEYGDLPSELVAGALQHTVGGKGKWRFWQKKDELEAKIGEAREMLDKYTEEGDINQMQTERDAFEADLRSIDQQSQQLQSTVDKLTIALSKPNPDPGTVMELRARLQKLTNGLEQADTGNSGERDAESQAIMDESNDLIQRALDAVGGNTDAQSAPEPSVDNVTQEMGASARDAFNSVDAEVPQAISILDELLGTPTVPGQSLADNAQSVGDSVESAQNSMNRFGANMLQDPGGTIQSGIDWASGLFSSSNKQPQRQSETAPVPAPAAPQQSPQAAPAPEPAPAAPQIDDTVLNEAVNDPIGTLEAIIAESGLPNEVGQEIQQTLVMLQSGRQMPAASKAQFQERLQGILAQIAQQRENNPQDPIAQLLSNSEKWLNF